MTSPTDRRTFSDEDAHPLPGQNPALRQVTHRMDDAYAVRLLDALTAGPPTIRAHDGQRLLPSPSP